MRHAEHVAWQRVGEEVVVVDLDTHRAMGFNPVGSLIWELIGQTDESTLARIVAERFAVPLERSATDVRAFLSDLTARGLLEESA